MSVNNLGKNIKIIKRIINVIFSVFLFIMVSSLISGIEELTMILAFNRVLTRAMTGIMKLRIVINRKEMAQILRLSLLCQIGLFREENMQPICEGQIFKTREADLKDQGVGFKDLEVDSKDPGVDTKDPEVVINPMVLKIHQQVQKWTQPICIRLGRPRNKWKIVQSSNSPEKSSLSMTS